MRTSLRSFSLVLLTFAAVVPNAGAACDAVTAYIQALNGGQRPATVFDPTSCQEDYAPALAKALAAYTLKSAPADVEAVVGELQGAYRTAQRKTSFNTLAAAVQEELAPKGFRLPDSYNALDALPRYAKPVPAAPPPPAPVKKLVTPAPAPVTQATPPKSQWKASPEAIGIASLLCTIASAVLLAVLFLRGKGALDRQSQALAATVNDDASRRDAALSACNTKLSGIDTGQQTLARQLETWSERFPPDAQILGPQHLDGVTAALCELRDRIERTRSGDGSVVALERELLGDSWKRFRANKDLSAMFDSAASDERWKEISHRLLHDLPKLVPDDLKPSLEAALAPARDYNGFVGRLNMIPLVVNGDVARLENEAQELRRTRELLQLLSLGPTAIGERLGFHVKSWVTDHFLGFADLYLQRDQQARLERRREPALEEGVGIVRDILRLAAVEPIDVELGKTAFDSARHIGRSTERDARYSDGVIVGVIRNGFIAAGSEVIRQPEVVVNRTR